MSTLNIRRTPGPGIRKRTAWPRWIRAAAAALAILFIPMPTPAAGQVIRGRVVDAESGAAIPLARVTVSGSGQRTTRMFSDAEGRFAFPLRRGGSVRVRVTRAGYAETRTGALRVGAQDTVDVDVRVSAVAHRLDPVTVSARRRRLKADGRFYETVDSVNARAHVVGQSRSVRARGSFPTPDLCYHLSGNADRTQSVITLTVQARGKRELCDGAGGGFVYDVTVSRLPPGVYTVRVLHAFQGEGRPPAQVEHTTVTVR